MNRKAVPPLLVVDLSKGRAGALCAKLFGMGGANVIKLGDEEFPGFRGNHRCRSTNRCFTSTVNVVQGGGSRRTRGE